MNNHNPEEKKNVEYTAARPDSTTTVAYTPQSVITEASLYMKQRYQEQVEASKKRS